MTPEQFAKLECANYQTDGSCLGVGIGDKGEAVRFRPKGRCWLSQPVQRCVYFEECVAPLPSRLEVNGPPTGAYIKKAPAWRQRVADYYEALREYRLKTNTATAGKRICPDCKMRPLEPGFTYCSECADKRTKASQRRRNERRKISEPPKED